MAGRLEPPDGGWGWIVVLSAFFQSALVFGVLRSFGVFFLEFVEVFKEPAVRVSWITSIGIAVQQFGSTGWALSFAPTIACLSRYFSKRRSLATGLALTGVGLSSFVFAPFFQWLITYYAWRGALLLVAALSLHLVACGALLRPLRLAEDPTVGSPMAQLVSLLHHRPFLCYSVALTLINAGYFIPYVHLSAHAQDLGWDPLPAAFLLSLAAVADLIGRVFSGWLGDVCPGPVARLLALWSFLTGMTLALLPVAQQSLVLTALAIAYGFASGALTPVAFSVLPELVGVGRIYCGLGLLQMVESVGGLLGAPLSGYLRDLTGSYTVSFVVAGAFLLSGSMMLFTLPGFFCCFKPSASEQYSVAKSLEVRVSPGTAEYGEGSPGAQDP
uniref:Monocarboxylate transporter 13 isoform X2 n=1 Tax=Phascolarctos cinereus TaxID=38626 RepID=A0A6P5IJM5_PHACI|nr:monocarboxylate transporter 13 isoform X2 [Phascolarctos cinereus]